MKKGKHPLLKIIVSHNDKGIALRPEVARAMFNVVLCMPAFQNRMVFQDPLKVDDIGFNISIQVIILNTVYLDNLFIGPQSIVVIVGKPCGVEACCVSLEGASLELDYRGIWRNKQVFRECYDRFIVIWIRSVIWLL
jgi:hypothetical protein